MLREEIEHEILKLKLAAPDYTFNKNLLLLDYSTFASLVLAFAGQNALDQLATELKKIKGVPEGLPSSEALLAKFLERAAETAGEQLTERVIDFGELILTGGTSSLVGLLKKIYWR
jgi:hypothetical protein